MATLQDAYDTMTAIGFHVTLFGATREKATRYFFLLEEFKRAYYHETGLELPVENKRAKKKMLGKKCTHILNQIKNDFWGLLN
jgi:hypothetical protein